jgi:hypothetical protein
MEGVKLVDELKCAAYVADLIAGSNSNARVQALIPPQAKKATKAQLKALAPAVEKNNGLMFPQTRQNILMFKATAESAPEERISQVLRN